MDIISVIDRYLVSEKKGICKSCGRKKDLNDEGLCQDCVKSKKGPSKRKGGGMYI